MNLISSVKKAEHYIEEKDYDSARTSIDQIVRTMLPVNLSFFQTDKDTDFAQLYAWGLKAIDIYCTLNRYTPISDEDDSVYSILDQLASVFPNHTNIRKTVDLMKHQIREGDRESSGLTEYSDPNLEGIIADPPETVVDYIGLALSAGNTDNEKREIHNWVASLAGHAYTNLIFESFADKLQGLIREIRSLALYQARQILYECVEEHIKGNGEITRFSDLVGDIIGKYHEQLARMSEGVEEFERGFQNYIKDSEIPEEFRNPKELIANLYRAHVIVSDKEFFNRLKYGISAVIRIGESPLGQRLMEQGLKIKPTSTFDVVSPAKFALPSHLPLIYLARGAFNEAYLSVERGKEDNPQEEDLWVIKIFAPSTRGAAILSQASWSLSEQSSQPTVNPQLIKNPHVCTSVSYALESGLKYIAEEVYYQTLETVIQENKTNHFDLPKTIDVSLQLISGMAAIHNKNILHNDFKPDNVGRKVVRGKEGLEEIYMISDFGIAEFPNRPKKGKVGALIYMSPEVQEGENATRQSDIYSLGLTSYFLSTGNVPFIDMGEEGRFCFTPGNGRTESTGIILDRKKDMAYYRKMQKEMAAQLGNTEAAEKLSKMFHPDPNQRYDSADEAYRIIQTVRSNVAC